MKFSGMIGIFFLLAFSAFAQDPSIVLAFGGGGSQFSEPHVGMSGSIGFRVADGTYAITSLDMGTKFDPSTQTRASVSTIRTGMQKRIAGQGPLTLFARLAAGISAGAGNGV